jgi:hypothetical protein
MKENPTSASLAQGNGPHDCTQVAMAGEKRSIAGAPAKKECNKFDLTAGSVFLIGPSIIMIRAGDLLLVVPPLYLRSQF